VPRFDGAAAQKDAVLPFGNAPHHDLGILVVDRVAGIADPPWQVVARRDSPGDACTAVAAEIHGRSGREDARIIAETRAGGGSG
jgi:hypothetical protein